MPHSSRATGAAFLVLILSAFPCSRGLLAQDGAPGDGVVNQGLRLDVARFKPFEVEYENEADDGRQVVNTVSYAIDTAAGPDPLIMRRLAQEYYDWSEGFPRKTRYYVIESVARAAGLQPVRTDVVNQYWSDAEAAWTSERMLATFSPGHVTRRLETSDDTTVMELDLPDGILQSGMVALVLGLQPDSPRNLVLTSYEWLAHQIAEERYETVGRDSITAAGRTFDAILVESSNTKTSEIIGRVYYRATVPRFFLSTADPVSPIVVTRVKEGK